MSGDPRQKWGSRWKFPVQATLDNQQEPRGGGRGSGPDCSWDGPWARHPGELVSPRCQVPPCAENLLPGPEPTLGVAPALGCSGAAGLKSQTSAAGPISRGRLRSGVLQPGQQQRSGFPCSCPPPPHSVCRGQCDCPHCLSPEGVGEASGAGPGLAGARC